MRRALKILSFAFYGIGALGLWAGDWCERHAQH